MGGPGAVKNHVKVSFCFLSTALDPQADVILSQNSFSFWDRFSIRSCVFHLFRPVPGGSPGGWSQVALGGLGAPWELFGSFFVEQRTRQKRPMGSHGAPWCPMVPPRAQEKTLLFFFAFFWCPRWVAEVTLGPPRAPWELFGGIFVEQRSHHGAPGAARGLMSTPVATISFFFVL